MNTIPPYIKPSQDRITPGAFQDLIDSAWNDLEDHTKKRIIEILEEYEVDYEV